MSIATPEQIKQIYTQHIGREPTPQELGHHASNRTGVEHLTNWAKQQTGTQPSVLGTSNPISNFTSAIMGKLKEYQGSTSADLIKRKNAILKKMYQKQSQITPEEQRVLSPGQQTAIRSGQVSALEPELEATKGQILDRKEARSRFLETFNIARQLGQDMETLKEKQRDRAFESLSIIAQSGEDIPQDQLGELISLTGLDAETLQGYYQTLQEKADYDKNIQDLEINLKKAQIFKAYKDSQTPEGVLTSDQISNLFKIQTAIRQDKDVKNFIDIRDSYDRVLASAENPSAAGDLALIFNYMKTLDPDSVVRESEFATAAASGAYGERLKAAGEKVLKGKRLSNEMRNDFVDRAKRLYEPKKKNYDRAIDMYKSQATAVNVPVDLVVRDYTTPGETTSGNIDVDLQDDIINNANTFETREILIQELMKEYPELTEEQISTKVYTLIPD